MAVKKRILVGSSIRQDLAVLQFHLSTLLAQELPPNVEVDYFFINDSESEDVSRMLFSLIPGVVVEDAEPRPDEAIYQIGDKTHHWNEETFDHLAKQKQKILDKALKEGYDYVFLVDSDLLLEKRTLSSLYYCDKPVVSAVFWTQWNGDDPSTLGPNVWLVNPYRQEGMGMSQPVFWKALMDRRLMHVYGGGACHLIKAEVLQAGVNYYPRVTNLPKDGMWQGEDRTFAIRLFNNHKMQFADPWPYVYHAYHPADRNPEKLAAVANELLHLPQVKAKFGDFISFLVEALEEKDLADRHFCVRGRLGGLEMLPIMEKTLMELEVGEQAIIEVTFPSWWPVNANEKRMLRLHLLDAKPYGFPPVLIDHVMQDERR